MKGIFNILFKNKIKFILSLLLSVLFIIVGYYLSAVFYGNSTFAEIIKSPFDNYYNDATPVFMVFAFIFFEIVFIFIFLIKGSPKKGSIEEVKEVMESVEKKVEEEEKIIQENIANDIGDMSDIEKWFNISTGSEDESDDEEVIIENEFTNQLSEDGFSDDQIRCFIKIADIANHNDIVKMFKPEMSTEDINDYINIMYG